MTTHTFFLQLVLVGSFTIFQPSKVLGASHTCTCEYNANYPNGHCTCVPPIGGGGGKPEPIRRENGGKLPGIEFGGGDPPQPPGKPATHKCTCEYNELHPLGHCTCVPPIPGSGNGGRPQPVIEPFGEKRSPGPDKTGGTFQCSCFKNAEYPEGHCTCDREMCFNNNGKRICVSR